ncbi:unnamed protein product [Darwinula stevensoni]|uniref:Hedgehog protein Hint domain-containing protein n=1 Tax=Darwinula stevensoni TaxID=69355 RepID=A0A7R9AFP6_9CRUS|nr:unnamed protein product [Darwinula stevensoni]CAG0903494.1 unnamed protein product [Darwinula stevensoni]
MRFFAWIRCKTEYRSVALLGGIWAISCLPLLSGSHITLFHILKEIEDFQDRGSAAPKLRISRKLLLLQPSVEEMVLLRLPFRSLFSWLFYSPIGIWRSHPHGSPLNRLSRPRSLLMSSATSTSSYSLSLHLIFINVEMVPTGRDEGGEDKYSRVVMFFDRRPKEIAEYFSFTTLTNHTIHISASHLIYTKEGSHDPLATKYAWEVEEKEYLSVKEVDGNRRWKESPVVLIGSHLQQGAYVPITEDGSIVVDGILASCYASFPHRLSHLASIPARWIPEAWIPFYVQTLKALGNLMSWDQTPGMKMGAIRRVPTGRRILDSIHSPSLRFLLLSLTTL